MRIAAFLATAVFLAPPAFAQVDDTVAPAPTCVKPVVPAIGTKLDKKASDKLNAETNAYAACGNAYIAARREIAARHKAIVETQTNAGNAFATEFNAYATTLEAFSKAQAAEAAKTKK